MASDRDSAVGKGQVEASASAILSGRRRCDPLQNLAEGPASLSPVPSARARPDELEVLWACRPWRACFPSGSNADPQECAALKS
jgi:hypothetical protein